MLWWSSRLHLSHQKKDSEMRKDRSEFCWISKRERFCCHPEETSLSWMPHPTSFPVDPQNHRGRLRRLRLQNSTTLRCELRAISRVVSSSTRASERIVLLRVPENQPRIFRPTPGASATRATVP